MKSRIKQSGEGKHLGPVTGEEWTFIRLGEVVELLTGFPFESDRYVDDDNAPRLLRGDNVSQGTLRWDGAKRWPQNAVNEVADYWLREGDVILAMDRPWIDAGLKYASVRGTDLPSLLVQRVARLRGTRRLDTRFLKYVIASKAFTDHVLAVQTGTAVPHISGDQIRGFEFLLPSLREQHAISRVLGALDDKIELNQQMHRTLEAIAKAVFKHWFIDFDFPNERGKPYRSSGGEMVYKEELGKKIPRGWASGRIEGLCSSITNGGTPRRMEGGYWNGNIAWFKTGELTDGPLIDSEEHITEDGLKNSACKLWDMNTILIALYASPTVGRLGLLRTKGTSNQACSGLVAKKEVGYPFLFYTLFFKRSEFNNIAVGAAQQNISQNIVKETKSVIPPSQLLSKFNTVTESLFDKQTELIIQIQTLSHLRDSLLPKLMSGKIRVPAEVR